MTIEWRYRIEPDYGVLSVAGHLGPEAAHRFSGAVGWVLARGTGPVIVDLGELRGWSTEGQLAIIAAARRLAEGGRALELAAIPPDGSLVPDSTCPAIPVHCDLATALAVHAERATDSTEGDEPHEWRTGGWPD
ncbi:anti-sigma factor antagonist [Streptomyces sp. NPDC046821]|uniref:anti-sigma factor antagonist n=1 Tax=Streptomyces sp. NPDC046821 TaxID=3154702 RepID=UPI0033E7AD50